MNKPQIFDYPLFALGFRAFFLLAGVSGLVLIVLWTSILDGTLVTDNYYPKFYWHGHEMLLGYAVAVIAGFLLTAVKNWTGEQTPQWDKLAGLCLLWLYGRIVPFYSELLPDMFIAVVDFAFLPYLSYHIAKPILIAKKYKQLVFILILSILIISNGLVHAEILGFTNDTANLGIQLSIATIIMLILIIAGRIFPFFTERGLKGTLIIPNPSLDIIAIISAASVFTLQILELNTPLLAITAVIAMLANLARVANWHTLRVWYVPLLSVLYMGYGWIILGFGFIALAAYGLIPSSLALHAFTVGGIGILTLGMMARVALGHTGRALRASNAIALAFILINLATLFRVVMPMLLPDWYSNLVYFSTLCWLAAFSLFMLIYTPILSRARRDGKEG